MVVLARGTVALPPCARRTAAVCASREALEIVAARSALVALGGRTSYYGLLSTAGERLRGATMIDVVMPQLGESVAEGTVSKWLVREGDFVKREQPLLEVSTDKADTEIPAPSDGVVTQIVAPEGAVVPKGGLLCRLDENAEKAGGDAREAAASAPAPRHDTTPAPAPAQQTSGKKAEQTTVESAAAPASSPGETRRPGAPPLASPSARIYARELGVDLSRVQTNDKHGRIRGDDVKLAATSGGGTSGGGSQGDTVESRPAPAAARGAGSTPQGGSQAAELAHLIQAGGGFVPPIPGVGFGAYKVPPYTPKPGDQVIPFNRRRQITADHMVYSKVTSPHVVTVAEVDLHATSRLRDQHKDRLKKEGVSLTFLAFVCAATIKALREHPNMNARVLERSFAVLRDINLGIAVDTPGGLIVPSIKQADQLSLRGIAGNIDELATRARSGKITADDLAGTTFTVSNPGMKGNLFGGAIISQPNVGILRMGEIKKRVVVVTKDGEDTMAIHPVMFLALSYDHRIIDGVLANSFLWRVADILGRGELEV
jgi:2-oxoglutarate dehydrogenase E2 component (dihydrolipoamide succinyltransferase)